MVFLEVKEWFIDTVFGKVAMISWGDPAHPPILMVHGYMDTAATFTFLQEQLPDRYYYVAFDIPGHGKSCKLPVGPPPTQAVAVETMRTVVELMGWDRFVLLGHSMGGVIVISWGNPSGLPVLLVHGRQDSAATFVPLLKCLPETFNYVGMDLPGHGKSDPLPIGLMLTRFHFLSGVEYAVKHLKWDQFVFVGHSMGCEQGLFFNIIHPKKITKFIFLDPLPSFQRLQIHDFKEFYGMFYHEYYSNYKRHNNDERVYNKKQALETVMRARGLNEKQAELVLSRNLRAVGEDKYKLSWDKRLKFPAAQNYLPSYYYQLFSKNLPPTLIVSASNSLDPKNWKRNEIAIQLVSRLQKTTDNFYIETVEGGHDVHLTDPEPVAKCIVSFLNRNNEKAKL